MASSPHPVVYIDSDVEQAAWLYATFGPDGTWRTISQTMKLTPEGETQEILEIRLVTDETIHVPFMEATPDESLEGTGVDRTGVIEDIMHIAAQFAETNPPHHPGSLPRFPVPARAYEYALAVPMPILAVDDTGHRGLYSPPRQVVVSVTDNTLVGFGDFPGFDPEQWPPTRVGDWPPAQLTHMPEQQMQGVIQRFSACWSRVLEAWFTRDQATNEARLGDDIRESLRWRAMLDTPGFEAIYERLNPEFERWLREH